MYLRRCEILIIDVREVQLGRLQRFVNVRVVGDIRTGLDDED